MGFQYRKLLQPCKLIFLTLASYPLFIVLFVVFSIYRNIINIILRIKHGENYGGLFEKQDSFFFSKYASKPYITSVLILKTEKERDFVNEFRNEVQEKLFKNPDNYPKITGKLATFSGYPYIIKNGCDMNKCVNPLPVPEDVEYDESYFKELTGSIINKPLPQNGSATCEFLPSPKPLKRNKNDRFYYYPVIVRFHHAVADGTLLMAFVLRILGDDNSEVYSENLFEKKPKKMSLLDTLNVNIKKITETLKLSIYIFFMGFGKHLYTFFLQPADQSEIHGPHLTENKFVAWNAENNVKYVPMVKRIKNRIDSKFFLIVSTAVTAALSNYFKRNSYSIPESTKAAIPITLSFPKLDRSKPVPLTNKFSVALVELPTHNYSTSIIDTVKRVTEKYAELNYWEILLNKLLASQIGIFPIQLVKVIPQFQIHTSLISNVPGGSQVTLLGGSIVDKVIPLAPNYNKMGISITILTYDDRFQIGILADKILMKSQKEVQLVVDDIYEYIDLLDKESMNIEKKHY